MIKHFLIVFFFLTTSTLYGSQNNPIGYVDEYWWGKPDAEKVELPLYDAPKGKQIGALPIWIAGSEGSDLLPFEINGNEIDMNSQDVFLTGYKGEISRLKYYESDGDWVRVLVRSHGKGVWFKTGKKDYVTLTTISFIEDIIQYDGYLLYGYDGYRLRKNPFVGDNIIITLNKRHHVVKKFTGKVKGSWAEAVIYETKEPMDGCYNDTDLNAKWTGRKWTGWIKVVDDRGLPKDIRYYSSC
jgi:hypothetical protein